MAKKTGHCFDFTIHLCCPRKQIITKVSVSIIACSSPLSLPQSVIVKKKEPTSTRLRPPIVRDVERARQKRSLRVPSDEMLERKVFISKQYFSALNICFTNIATKLKRKTDK